MAGMIEPRRLIVTNQFQRYHVSWDAIRNLDHSPSLFQADFAIEGKRLLSTANCVSSITAS